MEKEAYKKMFEDEGGHWWFRGRREIVANLIDKFRLRKPGKILDIGSGTGYNLLWLSRYSSDIRGLEPSEEAIEFSNSRQKFNIIKGVFPIDAPKDKFDLITMFDVLEHVDNDVEGLKKISELLAPGGIAVLTVPAFDYLWSEHDEILHHKRRYSIKQLKKIITDIDGLEMLKISYFNLFLFLPAFAVRLIKKIFNLKTGKADDFHGGKIINFLLSAIFSAEKYLLRITDLPFGLSIVAVLKKK